MPQSRTKRVSIQKLAIIYRMDRGQATPEDMLSIHSGVFSGIPESKGLEFGNWLDRCRQTIDVYEE